VMTGDSEWSDRFGWNEANPGGKGLASFKPRPSPSMTTISNTLVSMAI